jgi:cell division protein FtsQ
VRDAVVTKAYPDKLVIRITERTPFAVWQNGQALYLVERDGSEIGPFDPRYGNLPLVVGRGANRHAAEIVSQVAKFRELDGEVVSYARLGDRRWDLHLRGGAVVRLPEIGGAKALEQYAQLRRSDDLDRRAIESVDLRLTDRVVVRISGEAAAARKEDVNRVIKKSLQSAGRRT